MSDIKSLEIPFAQWGMDSLLNADGTMCCLGHLSKACGIHSELLRDKWAPSRYWESVPEWVRACSVDCGYAVVINDDRLMSVEEKVQKLKSLFAQHGIELTFSGDIKDAKV